MILENAANHSERGEHSEKPMAYDFLWIHLFGERLYFSKFKVFAVPAVSSWFELRSLG